MRASWRDYVGIVALLAAGLGAAGLADRLGGGWTAALMAFGLWLVAAGSVLQWVEKGRG